MCENFVSEFLLWYSQVSGDWIKGHVGLADCTGGRIPFIYLFVGVGGVLVGDCSRLSQVSVDWTR